MLRIWDSGASQGMTDRSFVSSDASVKGKKITIHTGNGPVISDIYESVMVSPGLVQTNVALPATANTVSIGSLNVECKVGFQWLQPLSHDTGCSFGFQALSPTDLDAPILDQLASSSNCVSSNSLKRGPCIMMAYLSFSPAQLPQGLVKDSTQILC